MRYEESACIHILLRPKTYILTNPWCGAGEGGDGGVRHGHDRHGGDGFGDGHGRDRHQRER